MNKRGSSFGKGVSIFLFIIGMIILWVGSCFGIGSIGFGMSFEQSGFSAVIGAIVFYLAFILPTVLVIWLSVKFSKQLKNKQ